MATASAKECRMSSSSSVVPRRVAAVILPDLMLELVQKGIRPRSSKKTLASSLKKKNSHQEPSPIVASGKGTQRQRVALIGVVLLEASQESPAFETVALSEGKPSLDPRSHLAAVSEEARRLGVKPGQSLTEARAMAAWLEIVPLSRSRLVAALGQVAEALMAYGPTVSIEAPDTVWVDVSGTAHLVGGEDSLAEDILSMVLTLGHRARVAVSVGPRISQSFARWYTGGSAMAVPSGETQRRVSALPLNALPLDIEIISWLMRLGIFTVGELASLPRSATSARLGEQARSVFDFCRGEDEQPLLPYEPAQVLVESQEWEEPVDGNERVLFVLRGLVARLSARLAGRGMAACECSLVLLREKAMARIREQSPELRLTLRFAVPLWREDEISRVLRVKLEQQQRVGLLCGVRLEVSNLAAALGRQLDFSCVAAGLSVGNGVDEVLPILIAELSADVGANCVGVLRLFDAHRPELKSALRPLGPRELSSSTSTPPVRGRKAVPYSDLRAPTRLLPKPVVVEEPLRVGSLVSLGKKIYGIEGVEFEQRLESVEWWSRQATSRDYVRLVLGNSEGRFEVLAYVDRRTRRRFIYAIAD